MYGVRRSDEVPWRQQQQQQQQQVQWSTWHDSDTVSDCQWLSEMVRRRDSSRTCQESRDHRPSTTRTNVSFTKLNSKQQNFNLTQKMCRVYTTREDYTVSQKKGCHPNHGYNFVSSWSICKILSLLQTAVNFQQNSYWVTHHTLRMLLHYLGKLKNQKFAVCMHACWKFTAVCSSEKILQIDQELTKL